MIKIIHLSDLHFRLNWEEDQELVLSAFFKDLAKQIETFNKLDVYMAFSGDFVFSGAKPELYNAFYKYFDEQLNNLKILKNQRICIPGNHDVSQKYIEDNFTEHEGILKQLSNETEFNNFISKRKPIFIEKFSSYFQFESSFCGFGVGGGDSIGGNGFNIREGISIYCLNSALCSSGAYNNISDKGRLSIDTRSLQRWILSCDAATKILIMHHSVDWLTEWAQIELKKKLSNTFSLCLSGHKHDQEVFHSFNNGCELIECSAPPLLTNKNGNLGYSIITVSNKGVLEIQYRQWIKSNKFVTGVNFSNTDDGKVVINKAEVARVMEQKDEMTNFLNQNLNEALQAFSSQPICWVEPILSSSTDLLQVNINENNKNLVKIEEIIAYPDSIIIKAPPQFGLTCLSHYFIKKAWDSDSSVWIYLDSKIVKSHTINNFVKKELEKRKAETKNVKCIILDSWTLNDKDSFTLLKNLCEMFSNIRIIVMQTIDDISFTSAPKSETIHRDFKVLHLLALSRGHIRKVVSEYNNKRHIGEEDSVIHKVVSDLDVLNIHRTPLNCLTILKVSEKYYDESPVNRTKMLERVLTLLFDTDEIPNYKSKPDVTDCEFVLGFFCEKMIRENKYQFSREEFLSTIKKFCIENLIGLEIETVFDILYSNTIIIKRLDLYVFRASYWIYYFAAQRMHHSDDFSNFMLDNKLYLSFPEIIEFYTGIDRRRGNALLILFKDLKDTCDIVFNKVGIPDGMDPYKYARWEPTQESIEKMQNLIGENVIKSSLPDSVKDKYADRTYNPIRPYDQSIHQIFHEYSLHVLMQSIKSASRALRNSDFVSPNIKRDLLNELIRGWEQISKVLFALTPILASEGEAAFEGQNFILHGDFGSTLEVRANKIIKVIPNNVVRYFKDDLFSNKIGPLLYDQLNKETSELKKLELILLIIYERPTNWKSQVHKYIVSIPKNSFYLLKVLTALDLEYQFSYSSPTTLKEIGTLIKICLAKHQYGDSNPGLNKIKMIPNNALPKREIDDIDEVE